MIVTLPRPRAPVDRRPAPLSSLLSPVMSRVEREAAKDVWAPYRWDPHRYIAERLGIGMWRGAKNCTCCERPGHAHPGQAEVVDAYLDAMRAQDERDRYESGEITAENLRKYDPTRVIRNEFRVPGGHSTGKTNCVAAIASHFFDCFAPCVISLVAPGKTQVVDQVLKEIKILRSGKGLPGKVMTESIRGPRDGESEKHYIRVAVTGDAHGTGGERLQGMHAPRQLVIMDESEGILEQFRSPIQSWLSGGQGVIIMLANPKRRTGWYHRCKAEPQVANMELSCLWHPNVLSGREVIKGAVRRDYVMGKLKGCRKVDRHDPDRDTFELPWLPGAIWEPDEEFSFRVLGRAPAQTSSRCFCPPARFEAAKRGGMAFQIPRGA